MRWQNNSSCQRVPTVANDLCALPELFQAISSHSLSHFHVGPACHRLPLAGSHLLCPPLEPEPPWPPPLGPRALRAALGHELGRQTQELRGTLEFRSVVERVSRIQSAFGTRPGSYCFLASCTSVDTKAHEVYCTGARPRPATESCPATRTSSNRLRKDGAMNVLVCTRAICRTGSSSSTPAATTTCIARRRSKTGGRRHKQRGPERSAWADLKLRFTKERAGCLRGFTVS
jgi:hypothetical protein